MSASVPTEVGTKGTVGSLVKKEMEYFRRLEFRHTGKKESASSEVNSCLNLHFLVRRKQKKKSFRLPATCSVVEVAELHGVSSFKYKNLQTQEY
ncbi:hypothetical protein DCAR_0831234 [Daucus carota subsp. sativus]|uniref:Uncharacterized protein n=1 Tax=Daucus carota subsp. sativus TaxID=79200 RepID=A0AAF0XPD1_DAUCS|nr:hypothetical protein DCAR_0831234 [Daucus carota subsp. sativus]